MKIRIFLFSVVLFLLASCAPKQNFSEMEIPANIIPPDSMIEIIAEIQYNEAVIREFKRISQHSEERVKEYFELIFEKHHITSKKYRESLDFYEKNLDEFERIYTEVVTRLTQMKTEVENEEIKDTLEVLTKE